MTTCQSKVVPHPTIFNCETQAQHCPHQEHTEIAVGPFVVWPELEGFKRDQKNLEIKSGKYEKLQKRVDDED